MFSSGPSSQTISFPQSKVYINKSHRYPKPIPLYSTSRKIKTVTSVQQPFKQIPVDENVYNRSQEIPSPSKDIVANIDAGVKRVKSAVIGRVVNSGHKRNNDQYMGWLLKARLEPLLIQRKPGKPTVHECKGIVACCRRSTTNFIRSKHVKCARARSLPPSQRFCSDKLITTSGRLLANRATTQAQRGNPTDKISTDKRQISSEQDTTQDNTGPYPATITRENNLLQKAYRKEYMDNTNLLSPIRMITVGKSSTSMPQLETKYKCLSGQFCGKYNVPGTPDNKHTNNVLVPRYGMFNAEECYVYEHDIKVQNSKQPMVHPPVQDACNFNMELDFMLDKFDSDDEDDNSRTQNDINKIANKYYGRAGTISGMVDWEDMVSSIANGALDMSGSQRHKKEKKSTKLRSPIMFTETKRPTKIKSTAVKPAYFDKEEKITGVSDDVLWYDVNCLRSRDN